MVIAVIGGSGVLGKEVVPRLVERNYRVRVLARSSPKVQRWAACLGAEYRECDILDPESLVRALNGTSVVVNLATSVPRPGTHADWTLNDRIRIEGTRNAVEACKRAGVQGFVQQSIAHLVADGTQDILSESAPLRPSVVTKSAVTMEETVSNSGLRWSILRGGAFYGGTSGRDAYWRAQARSGELACPGDGSAYLSLVHVSDMAAAMVSAVERRLESTILAVVDDAPTTYKQLFDYIAAVEGAPAPKLGGPPMWPSFRIDNEKAKACLEWAPRYATFKSGFC